MSTSQGSVAVRGARIMSARVVQSTHEAAPSVHGYPLVFNLVFLQNSPDSK
jgi:hypothetical protein